MSDGNAVSLALGSLARSGATAAAPAGTASGTDRSRVKELSQEFESLMLLQVMRQVRETMTSLGGDDDQEAKAVGGDLGAMNDTIDGELARYLSKAGGFGLSGYLQRALAHQQDGAGLSGIAAAASAAGAAANDAVPATDGASDPVLENSVPVETATPAGHAPTSPPTSLIPAVSPAGAAADEPLSYQGLVTSPFGWRTDPIVHTPRFHGGVDIRAAYGQEVPSAGGGTVVFAGEQNGYGTTVVVEHPSGLRTRYAHLSATSVRAGDQITEGQTVGRAGQSGRSTGPHVHLELTRGSQRLDPTSVVRSSAFKRTGLAAD